MIAMNLAVIIPGFTLILSLSVVPHLPTTTHDQIGYGPVNGDVRFVSTGVLVADYTNVAIPVEWNAGEQLVWVMDDELWGEVPESALVALSEEVVVLVDEVLS
jgi:hypothetical protein